MVCLIFFFTHYCPDALSVCVTNSEVTRYEIPYLTRAQIPSAPGGGYNIRYLVGGWVGSKAVFYIPHGRGQHSSLLAPSFLRRVCRVSRVWPTIVGRVPAVEAEDAIKTQKNSPRGESNSRFCPGTAYMVQK